MEKENAKTGVLLEKGEKIRMQNIQSAVGLALLNDARYVDFVGPFSDKKTRTPPVSILKKEN